ncbi:hypothetical protein [Parabacteroides sp. AM08-6]|uniref:hypothetical protein n=1 Tax=Parabacteroides sp. AM08-6 TaxID=2292053 RepID=UPI000EFF097E|nr:hypothetical protein [Parabacteroides sp. AM08-6]RHJ76307.1 hypothetical protein DW103_16975 [Parabacteroides sp. AM08-6]
MRKILFFRIALVLALINVMMISGCVAVSESSKVELLSPFWSFKTLPVAQSRLSGQSPQASLSVPSDITKGFTLTFRVNLEDFDSEQNILEIPEVMRVCLRQHDVNDRKQQNYPAFKMPDGSVPVLEASLALQLPVEANPVQDMIIGIPFAILDEPYGEHEVVLNFTGVRWTMYVDGKLLDNDFPLGYPLAEKMKGWKLNTQYVREAAIYFPAIQPERVQSPVPLLTPGIQYWTPAAHNAWVGDVVTFFHSGRYHIFYLFDRRGHASKFGRGGHYFEHLSTADFKTWTEHEAATPIEEQWETFGTGTPFVFDGKLCLSYGLHTTRIYPREKTALPLQWEYLEKHGYTGSFNYDTITVVPAGSTYSISGDGVSNFKKTHLLYHPCENPSIYTDPDGNLRMLANYGAKGTWGTDKVAGGWQCLNADFPLGGDCTFFFRWGNYDYIIGGFTRLWSKPADAPEIAYQDIVSQGLDFYNGLSVPAITEIPGGRFLMAGWMQLAPWGGPLIIHELIQYPDGRVGTKWMEEIIPEIGKSELLAKKLTETETFSMDNQSFMVSFDVFPSKVEEGKFGILFLSGEGEKDACEWQLDMNDRRAQFGVGSTLDFSAKEKSLREGGNPQQVRNYALENLVGVEKPFTVRLLVNRTDKFGGSIIDVEIAGQRTMISYRPGLTVGKLLFRTDGVELKNIKIAPVK